MRAGDSPEASAPTEAAVRAVLETVLDPEVPVLSIVDLGIVRHVRVDGDRVTVGLSPTYSGCPATEVIEQSVERALSKAGCTNVHLDRVLSPPWTTRWISDAGRQKLRNYGIAPPTDERGSKHALTGDDRPRRCPRCRSEHTERVSEFGSTPCKALYKCIDCREPFEYFKCI